MLFNAILVRKRKLKILYIGLFGGEFIFRQLFGLWNKKQVKNKVYLGRESLTVNLKKSGEQPRVPRPSFSSSNSRSLRCPSDSRPLYHSAILGRTLLLVHQYLNLVYQFLRSTEFHTVPHLFCTFTVSYSNTQYYLFFTH